MALGELGRKATRTSRPLLSAELHILSGQTGARIGQRNAEVCIYAYRKNGKGSKGPMRLSDLAGHDLKATRQIDDW